MDFYKKIFASFLLYAVLLLAFWIRIQDVERLPIGHFTGNDPYLYYWQAQTIEEQGGLSARDMHRWLPDGRDNQQLLSLYSYALAYSYKAIGWLFPKLTLYDIQLYVPILCFTLGLGILCFFFKRSYGVFFAVIFGMLLATLPGSIDRSSIGFGDRDAWCWMLGTLAVISYLWREQMKPGWHRYIVTALSGFIVFLGGMSWEGFGFFLTIILSTEIWKFCVTKTEQHFKEYILWTLMFVPWLVLISPVYRSGYGYSTHVAALMLFPPLTVCALRGIRYLLLAYVEQLRPHSLKLARGLTLLAIIVGIGYFYLQVETFETTAFAFRESRLMQNIGELADPDFGFWKNRYGAVFVLGSIGVMSACLQLWKWKGFPLALSLSLFTVTTFFRTQVNGWIGSDMCDMLFFASLGLTLLCLGIACLRKEIAKNEFVMIAMVVWFFLWVGLSRGGRRHDFFTGIPLAYGTAWLLSLSPTHLIQKLKNTKVVYPHIKEKWVTACFASIVLISTMFWSPIGGHSTRSIHAAKMRPLVPRTQGLGDAFQWMNSMLPHSTVVAANWEHGSQLNVLADVKTIIDQDHYIPHWVYFYYRHVFCAESKHEALSFLKTHEATHLMLTEWGVTYGSWKYSVIGSDENNDRQFRFYELTRTETPIGTPYRMQPHGTDTPVKFIDIARTSPDTLTIIAHFKDENEVVAAGGLGGTLMRDITVERTINMPKTRISVDIENGGLILDFDTESRLGSAYYVPPLGWNSLAVELFFRGKHGDAFIPVYPTDADTTEEVKVWEIRYPPDIETDEKYLATEPEPPQPEKADEK